MTGCNCAKREEGEGRGIRHTFEINNPSRSPSQRVPAWTPAQSTDETVAIPGGHEGGFLGQFAEGDLQKGLGVQGVFWGWDDWTGLAEEEQGRGCG